VFFQFDVPLLAVYLFAPTRVSTLLAVKKSQVMGRKQCGVRQ
jgi:hypothetical protein